VSFCSGLMPVQLSTLDSPRVAWLQEFCNGGSLRQALVSGALQSPALRRRWPVVTGVLADIADGMHHIHGKRICHGDLNPSNILLKVRIASRAGTCGGRSSRPRANGRPLAHNRQDQTEC
jgi:tRNA A-37 threonylcarbamoyl transferase component Bud32